MASAVWEGVAGRLDQLTLDVRHVYGFIALAIVIVLLRRLLHVRGERSNSGSKTSTTKGSNVFADFGMFFYASFIKPHSGDQNGSGQQAALESFYKAQADVYDATRKVLLKGREDMLGLVAAQLQYKEEKGAWKSHRPVWVDVGGGTGYNIEAMQAYVDVPSFFSKVYLVDLSPSLLDVARNRFARLGWDVEVVCQDARTFRLPNAIDSKSALSSDLIKTSNDGQVNHGADLVTMSYSLSMIPDYYSVLDSMTSLMARDAIIGVIDFYVQSIVEISGRTYTGGSFNRHVTWLGRVFWRAWFDMDRVGLEGARRDYLEYRFGTLKSVDERNYILGGIPYYIFMGTQRELVDPNATDVDYTHNFIESLDASCTESPYLSPKVHRAEMHQAVEKAVPIAMRSKAYQCAIVNLSADIPLPSVFYQNNHRRIYYDDQLRKHTQFNNEYIYAFTWEDPRVDHELLKIGTDDVVLCVTSAGDNVLDYLYKANPRRIHAVDLNPNQNHLLELKIAAFRSLSHGEMWQMFGEGKFSAFRAALITKLSPHMSSQACQYWLKHGKAFTTCGLYETGGSRHAIKLVRWLFTLLGMKAEVKRFCSAKTLDEQKRIWPRIRRVLLSKPLHWAVVSTEWFAWKAAGVPPAQRKMIIEDGADRGDYDIRGEAMWQYVVDTLDPAVMNTHISSDNYFYLLCIQGQYTKSCHPEYLSEAAHRKLSHPGAFDGVRIHTDELQEVISRLAPGTLTHAVVMDSMDWFNPGDTQADIQVRALRRALKVGGKVLLRSAGLKPWYISVFERNDFGTVRVGARLPGACIDRVNMYASAWICTKISDESAATTEISETTREPTPPPTRGTSLSSTLEEADLGAPMMEDD